MRRLCLPLLLTLAAACSTTTTSIRPPSSFLDAGPRPKLMFLGTFHFADAGLDGYKPKHDINIMEPARQREVAALVERLARFRPTKVLIEARPADMEKLNGRYRDYLAGKYELKSNEIYQIAFRLAKRMGHTQLYGIDVKGRDYYDDAQWKVEKEKFGLATAPAAWDQRFQKLYEYDDELKTTMPLVDFLRYINSPQRLRAGHGAYLTGIFHAADDEDHFGPDNLSGWWYDRNLRIFDQIWRAAHDPSDRALVLIGAGHLPILLHAAQSSPEFEWVDVLSVLR
jgi:hypothetical protein